MVYYKFINNIAVNFTIKNWTGDNNSNYHQSEDTFTNVFVKNFADKLDEDKLKEMFSVSYSYLFLQ